MNFIDLGSRLEPMVDDYLIERLENAALKLHHPQPHSICEFRNSQKGIGKYESVEVFGS